MSFYWLKDRTNQSQFIICWSPGINNRGDYYTKKFSAAYHIRKRPLCLYEPVKLTNNVVLPPQRPHVICKGVTKYSRLTKTNIHTKTNK